MDPQPAQRPWYRQGWPWFLLLLPATAVVASFVTLYIAISHPQSVVRDEYYKDGLAVNRSLAQAEAARALGLAGELAIEPATRLVTLRIAPADALPATLYLALLHPTDAELDRVLPLARLGEGEYAGTLDALPDGRRYLQLGASRDSSPWLLRGELDPRPNGISTLRPAAN